MISDEVYDKFNSNVIFFERNNDKKFDEWYEAIDIVS